MNRITEIMTPREGVSDDTLRIVSRPFPDGHYVKAGQIVVSLESSKTVFEVEAPCDGFLYIRAGLGDEVPSAGAIGVISETSLSTEYKYYDIDQRDSSSSAKAIRLPVVESAKWVSSKPTSIVARVPLSRGVDTRMSSRAKQYAREKGIDVAAFTNRGLIRSADISASTTNSMLDGRDIGLAGDNIIIVGGGGHTKMCIDLIRSTGRYRIVGVASSGLKCGDSVYGIPVLCSDTVEDLVRLRSDGIRLAVNGVGAAENHSLRAPVYERIKTAGLELPAIIHRFAVIEPSVHIDEGTQVMAGAYVGSSVEIGADCIINTGSIISHDCRIHDHVHIAPGSILAGNVTIGSGSLIGMGCQIFMRVDIGSNVMVANGLSVDVNLVDGAIMKHRATSK